MSKVDFNSDGLYFVTCPDCAEEREGWRDDNPKGRHETDWEYGDRCRWDNPCNLCGGSGDLCSTIIIERDTTQEQLEIMIAGLRLELDRVAP